MILTTAGEREILEQTGLKVGDKSQNDGEFGVATNCFR